ncbi:MAG: hypothetical protein GF355_17170 [Candidatus Eisenbacteria bacterium]|nr:hypothetical protein [Candidatus Eisenbacteria bacterium]
MWNSQYEVRPAGSVRFVTLYEPHDDGVRLQGAGRGITLERNLLVDAVDTGDDYPTTHGGSRPWLPTGINIAFSVQGIYGYPDIRENGSFFRHPGTNQVLLRHYGLLYKYG